MKTCILNLLQLESTYFLFLPFFLKASLWNTVSLTRFRALHNESNSTCHVFRGLNSPHRCRITSFSRLKRISLSGQDTLFIFDLLCLLNNKTKQNVFNWTQKKVFLKVIWSRCQPSFLFFSRRECVLKLPGLNSWIVVSIQQKSATTVA